METISRPDFEGYYSITDLDISGNNIKEIGSGAFQNIPYLDTLNVMDNKIERLENGVFEGLDKITFIILSSNGLASIEPNVFQPLSSLKYLYLQDNKLVCDCGLYDAINPLNTLVIAGHVKGNCNVSIPINEFYADDKLSCSSCDINSCQNNATCIPVDKINYNCSCSDKYYGQFCQLENACFHRPCQHNSTCLKTLDTFKCECSVGYFGELCQNEVPCYINSCQHDGICQRNRNQSNDYTCQCKAGYSGAHCQLSDGEESSGLAVGYIILIVVVIILILGVIIGLVIYFKKRDKYETIPLVRSKTEDA
ncbi:protein slit-like [Clytia hemisphaerica]